MILLILLYYGRGLNYAGALYSPQAGRLPKGAIFARPYASELTTVLVENAKYISQLSECEQANFR